MSLKLFIRFGKTEEVFVDYELKSSVRRAILSALNCLKKKLSEWG